MKRHHATVLLDVAPYTSRDGAEATIDQAIELGLARMGTFLGRQVELVAVSFGEHVTVYGRPYLALTVIGEEQ